MIVFSFALAMFAAMIIVEAFFVMSPKINAATTHLLRKMEHHRQSGFAERIIYDVKAMRRLGVWEFALGIFVFGVSLFL